MVAHELRREQAGACFGAQAQIHKGHGKRGVVTRIHQVAMEQHGGAHTHRRSTHRGQQGFGKDRDGFEKAKHLRGFGGWRLLQKISDVVASAEHGFVALHQHHFHFGVVRRHLQGISQCGIHAGIERILFVHPVQGQGEDAAFLVLKNASHACFPLITAHATKLGCGRGDQCNRAPSFFCRPR